MKKIKYLPYTLCMIFVVSCLQMTALGQSGADKNQIARMAALGSTVRWDVAAQNSGMTVTVAAPDGRTFRKEFKGGEAPDFAIVDKSGQRLPDGRYSWELRLTPVFSPGYKEALAKQRKDDEPEDVRASRKRTELPELVQSGTFTIMNGSVADPNAVEASAGPVSQVTEQPQPQAKTAANSAAKSLKHHPLLIAMPDQVIADDLIVQGSACIGLDCINGENFSFDTLRLKENNLRINYEDTSNSASFPSNDWRLTANDSANGGANRFSIEDATNSKTPFTVLGNAPTNSLFVRDNGKVGLRTGSPVLDLHIATTDTPSHRLEQTSGGGFTAQTWDIAGNEANFFIRDVTNGSKLPFRIRPGAPTSSLDMFSDKIQLGTSTQNVGIGTSSPTAKLDISNNTTGLAGMQITNTTSGAGAQIQNKLVNDTGAFAYYGLTSSGYTNAPILANRAFFGSNLVDTVIWTQGANDILLATGGINANNERMRVTSAGSIGIATSAPTSTLSVNGTADKPGGGSWGVFSDERLKNIKGNFSSGLKAVMQLQPLRYEYKPTNALNLNSRGEHIGFGAQALQKVIPEAVTKNENGYLMVNNDPIIWTMLNAIKEQQKEIEDLKAEVKELRAATQKRP